MKEIPILFSAMMVRSLKDLRKTQTRRVVKPDSPEAMALLINLYNGVEVEQAKDELLRCHCPYGEPGDLLYVRESHYRYGRWVKTGATKTGKTAWKFIPEKNGFPNFRYVDFPPAVIEKQTNRGVGWYKRPGLFMPKELSRIWLQVAGRKVELLQNISEEDARAEGILWHKSEIDGRIRYKDYMADASGYGDPEHDYPTVGMPVCSFSTLWQSINGEESWNLNPAVYAMTFKVVSTNGKP